MRYLKLLLKTIAIFAGVLLLIVIVFTLFTTTKRGYQVYSCKLSGGRWQIDPAPVGVLRMNLGYCYYPPDDEGKSCYQDSDCKVDCISSGETDTSGYILGNCGKYNITVCTPSIPHKTKDYEELKIKDCV